MSHRTELILTTVWAIGAIATTIKQAREDKKEIDEIIKECEKSKEDQSE